MFQSWLAPKMAGVTENFPENGLRVCERRPRAACGKHASRAFPGCWVLVTCRPGDLPLPLCLVTVRGVFPFPGQLLSV